MTQLSTNAALVLFLCAMTSPRDYGAEQLACLCGLTPPEAERALRELERKGLAASRKDGAEQLWRSADSPDALALTPPAACGSGGVPLYCLRLYEGRALDAVEELVSWAGGQQEARRAWALDFAIDEIVRTLLRAPLRGYDERERARFIELAIRANSMADFQGRVPRGMRVLLLKARGVARILDNASYLYILNTMLDVRKILFDNENVPPRDDGPGHLAPDEVRDKAHFLADAAPYISMYNYLQGSARQALDHFSLAGGTSPAAFAVAGENAVPQGAFSSAFAALAAVQFGDAGLAISILKTSLNRNARSAGCPTKSWLHSHLATVYLAAGRPEEALEHVDAALAVGLEQNVQCWMAAHTALAHYHVSRGRPRAAHRVLGRAVEEAGARGYRWGYSSPWFLDILYVFRRHGLADLPGYPLDHELKHCEEGRNPLLRAVAGRIRGDMLFRAGARLRDARLPLLKSRAFFKLQQLPAEKGKTCAVLAQACLAAGEQAQALRYAIEAWPCHEQFQPLGIYWSAELEAIMPAHRAGGWAEGDSAGETWRLAFFKALLGLNPESCDTFPQDMLACMARVLGASRACLFDTDDAGKPRLARTLNMTREQVFGGEGGFPLYLVEECLEGVPVSITREALGLPDTGEFNWQLACIPIPAVSANPADSADPAGFESKGRPHALYIEGDSFTRAGDMGESFLLACGELLGVLISRWIAASEGAHEAARPLAARSGSEDGARFIVYRSEAMRRVLEKADTAAQTDASVLIYGESGVGKELVARRIHEKSGRRGPFVAVNLSSLPEELFESEMLGYERGAFTGAFSRKIGLLEMADMGTLFIDEVPDISPRIQVKLLRLLQERNFMRLGSTRVLESDFRLIVATNRNLFAEMRQGSFRNDLFYRICVVPLFIPPLRERPEDIEALLQHYLGHFSRRHGRKEPAIRDEDARRLRAYAWPGNIRELKNVMERAVIYAREGRAEFSFDGEGFGEPDARPGIRSDGRDAGSGGSLAAAGEAPRPGTGMEELVRDMFGALPSARELEKQYILTVLRMTGGKVAGKSGAAALLGMSRSTLYDKMRALGISPAGGSPEEA